MTAPATRGNRHALGASLLLAALIGVILLVWVVRRVETPTPSAAVAADASPSSPTASLEPYREPARPDAAPAAPPRRELVATRPRAETPRPAPPPRPTPERPAATGRPDAVAGGGLVASQLVDRADRAFLAGEYEQAIREVERAIAMEPTAAAYVVLGNAQYKAGRLHEAERAFGGALRLDPSNQVASHRLGLMRRALARQAPR